MKTLKIISLLLLLLTFATSMRSQENAVVPQRTPEQEAVKQTEKLQQELNLTSEQAKQVYEINLRYARERQISNTRSEAVERMKNKNAEIQSVLTQEQNERLQTKRYERTTNDAPIVTRNQPNTSSGFRAPTEFRSNPIVRVPSSDMNFRSTYRSTTPTSGTQMPQSVRRSNPTTPQPSSSTPSATPSVRNTPQPPTRSSTGTTVVPRSSEPSTGSNRR